MNTTRPHALARLLVASIFTAVAGAQEKAETTVNPTIEAVSLFKNGVAVMTATFAADKPGVYRWDNPPQIIHGTFAIESAKPVAVTAALREVERSGKDLPPPDSLAEELAGSAVSVNLKAVDGPVEIEGTVPSSFPAGGRAAWDSEYASLREQPSYRAYYGYGGAAAAPPKSTVHTRFLPVDGPDGKRYYVSVDSIATVRVDRRGERTLKVEKNTLLFTVAEGGGPVRFSFLCRGATWAPSYQLDLTDPAKLTIRQQAMVRNEALALTGSEIRLITGFPNIRFAAVDSPLTGSSLARFFQQISGLGEADVARRGNVALQQAMVSNVGNFASPQALPQGPAEETIPTDDLHFQSIGRHAIEEGSALLAETASAPAPYERIVTWEIPDYRDEGYWDQQREQNFWRAVQNNAWDAVRFNNPLKFPISGGTATTQEKGAFRGQSEVSWTAPGQRATVRINKALSVNTTANEEELPNTRKAVRYAGRDRAQARFKATVTTKNLRAEPVTMVVKVLYTGDFVSADDKPQQRLRGEGRSYLNPRREMEWQYTLPAGESKTLTYQYDTWVER